MARQLRQHWPQTRMIVRADSGFCREKLNALVRAAGSGVWAGVCPQLQVREIIAPQMAQAKRHCEQTQQPARGSANSLTRR